MVKYLFLFIYIFILFYEKKIFDGHFWIASRVSLILTTPRHTSFINLWYLIT